MDGRKRGLEFLNTTTLCVRSIGEAGGPSALSIGVDEMVPNMLG